MSKIKTALAWLGGILSALLVAVLFWLGLKDKDLQPELTDGYDPLRDMIDDHFSELGKLRQNKIKLRIQRMQIDQRLCQQEHKDFKNAILAAIQSGDTDELAAIRSRYLRKYDIYRQAERSITSTPDN